MVDAADVVIAGARCAGTAAGVALAERGRRVIALDPSRFPSTTLSTHLLFPAGVAELARIGALPRVEKIGAPRLPRAALGGPDYDACGEYSPVDGIDYGLCVRREPLDMALVETARERGVEVREGHRVTDLVREGDRVTGVRALDAEGREYEVRTSLVIGADGRRSTVARLVGAEEPRLTHPNGRACYYAYYADPREEWRSTAAMWLDGRELGNAFPCDAGLTMVLLMPPIERVQDFRGNLQAEFDRTVTAIPGLADRLAGCVRDSRVFRSARHPSHFRRSSGPGWALAGDAGHFKDPVTAQGIRDAVRFARLLGEAAAPVLDDAPALDEAVRAWERNRDEECVHTYHWTNMLGRGDGLAHVQFELLRALTGRPEGVRQLLEVYSRIRDPRETLALSGLAAATWRALRTVPGERGSILSGTGRAAQAMAAAPGQTRRLLA